ncbi:hypothetical protein Tco_0750418 [Tanacetum coccineum]|uniref:Uncharacterized protein n=1 Tax=Tanacetum coccineum TaxID=301880 RepID=A0ABQ4Z4C0_9ASTR
MNLVTQLSYKIGILEADLMKTKKTYSSAYTKLILRVKKLESQIKIGKARRQDRVVHSDDEVFKDDSSKQGRKLSDSEVQEKEVLDTELLSISGRQLNKSYTAGGTVTYTRRSAEKRSRQDKGKAIMIEEEHKKKSKKELNKKGNYKINDFKGMSYNDIRPIFEKVLDFNQNIEPMDAEHGSGKQKSPEKSLEKFPKKMKSAEKVEEDDVAKETGAKRKKSIPRKSTRKRQKMEEDAEKEELKGFLDIIPREETFDRLDVEELYRLVKERYSASRPEGFDLMLWGDLHTLFEPDEDDEIWKDQHEYKLLS